MPIERVFIVSDFAELNGGQAKVAIDSARLLADAGIAVTFFAVSGPPDEALEHPKIDVTCLNQPDILSDTNRLRAMGRGIWNREAAHRLRQEIGGFDPKTTVLHAHGYAKALSPSVGPILTDGPLPSIYTMHEYFLACPNGGFYDYQKNEICTRKALGIDCLTTNCDVRKPAHKAWRVARQVATWGPGRIPRGLKDVIYISETQRRAMTPYMSPNTRMHYLPNPIEQTDAPKVDFKNNNVFLFIGRLNPEKGGLMFAKAAKKAGVKAVFVGDGAEADQIRAANPDAILTGWQTPAQVQEWIGKSKALVFPSLWYETFGLVAFEALARGVPVICGEWNAASEGVEHGVNGLLYKEPTIEALALSLSKADELKELESQPLLETMTPRVHLEKLLRIYHEISQP
ncbi:group 1 glycosyl transferase [Actibacterium atlanticum]|uniref:Group 1 glycosyl transferase n=1 Tax=Actibacterium atlanticum TaxID=1461693 RepID=A0A058ZLA3_9RHOB|nr:glycosyltransferase family 4 protein [Actibacterium atlanticum]KCV82318.1 group 1 glycosyl transferase [Actibacterium atlanticum]